MKTTVEISITQESPDLVKYTHCQTRYAAQILMATILEIESQGMTVEGASSTRSAVPLSYRSAYKMAAPYYIFNTNTRAIVLVNGQLENRPKGLTIPAHFVVSGSVVPTGFRCFKRGEDYIVIRKAQ
jgi:hypothetical protein